MFFTKSCSAPFVYIANENGSIFIFQNQPGTVKLIQWLNFFLSNHSSILLHPEDHDTFLPRKCRRQNLLNKPTQKTREKRDNASEINSNSNPIWIEVWNRTKDHEILKDLITLGKRESNIAPNMESANQMQEKKKIQNSEKSKPELRIHSKTFSPRKILFEIYRVYSIYKTGSHE